MIGMEKEEKEVFSHKYFNDIKVKNLKDFEEETPNGNIIKGLICKKANRFLGSLLITEIYLKEKDYTFETEQFVQAMPKIHYYDRNNIMFEEKQIVYPVFEKLDGSCLILYAIYHNDEVVEIIPKTRGVPVADSHIIDMYNEIDHANIKAFFGAFKEDRPTLLFELYGALNQHSIFYPQVRISIRLIGGTFNYRFLDWNELKWLESQYDFYLPFRIFNIVMFDGMWRIRVNPGIFHYYLFEGCSQEEIDECLKTEYPTQLDVIQALKSMITKINKNYSKKYNRQLLEGGVIDCYNKDGEYFKYLKVKSADIEEKCRAEHGVPRKFILKEVHKYFDEYGSHVKEIYKEDKNHVFEYVNRNLLEEFDSYVVEMKRTQSRIENIFFDMLEAKEPPKGLQDICNELVDEYPGTEISDLMRLFAQRYPEKKRHASIAYGIFESLL